MCIIGIKNQGSVTFNAIPSCIEGEVSGLARPENTDRRAIHGAPLSAH